MLEGESISCICDDLSGLHFSHAVFVMSIFDRLLLFILFGLSVVRNACVLQMSLSNVRVCGQLSSALRVRSIYAMCGFVIIIDVLIHA